MPDDLLHFYKEWDSQIQDAFQDFNNVPQPLSSLIEPDTMHKASNVAKGLEPMNSILNCFYNEDQSFMQIKEALLHNDAWGLLILAFVKIAGLLA